MDYDNFNISYLPLLTQNRISFNEMRMTGLKGNMSCAVNLCPVKILWILFFFKSTLPKISW